MLILQNYGDCGFESVSGVKGSETDLSVFVMAAIDAVFYKALVI